MAEAIVSTNDPVCAVSVCVVPSLIRETSFRSSEPLTVGNFTIQA
jgi:hypothetical protein